MKCEFTRKFLKQVDELRDKKLKAQIAAAIEQAEAAENITKINQLKKLQGVAGCYRIRVGTYRIGVKLEGDTLYFAAFDHRSVFYRWFP